MVEEQHTEPFWRSRGAYDDEVDCLGEVSGPYGALVESLCPGSTVYVPTSTT